MIAKISVDTIILRGLPIKNICRTLPQDQKFRSAHFYSSFYPLATETSPWCVVTVYDSSATKHFLSRRSLNVSEISLLFFSTCLKASAELSLSDAHAASVLILVERRNRANAQMGLVGVTLRDYRCMNM